MQARSPYRSTAILLVVVFLICASFGTNATGKTIMKTNTEQMNSSLMYAIIKTANQGKEFFNEKLVKNQESCAGCHTRRNFPQIIGKLVNNRTIAAIQHCYYSYMDSHKAIPEKTLNYILVYLLATGRNAQKESVF